MKNLVFITKGIEVPNIRTNIHFKSVMITCGVNF